MDPTPQEILSFLGLSDHSADKETINRLFARGFPTECRQRICQAVVPDKSCREHAGQGAFLTPQESHLLYRLTACWLQAMRQAKNPECARRLLIEPNVLLWGARPIGMALLNNQGWKSVMTALASPSRNANWHPTRLGLNHRRRRGRLP